MKKTMTFTMMFFLCGLVCLVFAGNAQILVRFSGPEASSSGKMEKHLGTIRAMTGVESFVKLPLVEGLYVIRFKNNRNARSGFSKLTHIRGIIYAHWARHYKPAVIGQADEFENGPNNPPIKPRPPKPGIEPDPGLGNNWNLPRNGVYKAWKYSTGKGVIAAVIDTGIDYNHKDLAYNMWRNPGESGSDENGESKETNGIDDDGNGFVDDVVGWDFFEKDALPYDDTLEEPGYELYFGHGTHVAGIIGAVKDNGFLDAGVAPEVQLMALRFMNPRGGSDADAILALGYAKQMGAHVINNSWGSRETSRALEDAFMALEDSGIVIVNAAGNEGRDIGPHPFYPARYELKNSITIAMNGTRNTIFWWSNYSHRFVHSSSAGYEIYSTLPNDSNGRKSGTSMAAPNYAGAVALARSLRPDLPPERIKALLKSRDPMQVPYPPRRTKFSKYSNPGFSVKWLFKHPDWE